MKKGNSMHESFSIFTEKQFSDLTKRARDFARRHGKEASMLNVFTAHTTCAIKVLENELLLLADIHMHLEREFSKEKTYMHDIISIRDVPPSERVNGHAHLKQLFLPTSESIPVVDGELLLGVWQSIFLIELDPARERRVIMTLL